MTRIVAKTSALAVALIFGAAVLSAGQASKTADKHPWAGFKPGSWVKIKSTTLTDVAGNKMSTITETKMTLLEKTADKVVLENEMTMMGQTTKTKFEMPLTGPKAAATPPAKAGVVPKLGSDTVTVAGKSLACKTVEMEMETGGMKIQSKTWTSEQVPGALVKSVSTHKAGQTTSEVVDFKAL